MVSSRNITINVGWGYNHILDPQRNKHYIPPFPHVYIPSMKK